MPQLILLYVTTMCRGGGAGICNLHVRELSVHIHSFEKWSGR